MNFPYLFFKFWSYPFISKEAFQTVLFFISFQNEVITPFVIPASYPLSKLSMYFNSHMQVNYIPSQLHVQNVCTKRVRCVTLLVCTCHFSICMCHFFKFSPYLNSIFKFMDYTLILCMETCVWYLTQSCTSSFAEYRINKLSSPAFWSCRETFLL